jgi:hypothetical protein
LGLLSFALDAGGDTATPVFTVAGFCSGEEDWQRFSELWSERLCRERIAYFRAAEAAHFRGQFQPFHDRTDRNEWRNALFSDLMDILKGHVYRKFGCSIVNPAFKTLDEQLAEEFSLNAYSLAGRTTDKHIREWIIAEWTRSTPIAIVFESGDQGIGKLQKRLTEDGCFPPQFRPKKDTIRKDGTIEHGYIPLQAADWLAYESCLAVQQVEGGKINEIADLRWPMREFVRIPGEPGVFTTENIRELEKSLNLIRSINEWEKHSGVAQSRPK